MTKKTLADNGQQLAALAAEMGASNDNTPNATNAMRLPELKINSQIDDEAGNSLPQGHFYIKGLENTAYMETVTLRPTANHFQYFHYDSKQKKLASKSKIIASFREEAIDTNGTIRCGKPVSSQLRDNPELKERYQDITCFRQVRGLVSGKGKTVDGETVEIVDQPVILMLKGTNFNGFEDNVIKALPQGRNLWDFNVQLTSERHKNGSVRWFTFKYKPAFQNPLAMDDNLVNQVTKMAEGIRSENARIQKAYDAALSNQTLDRAAIDALEGNLDSDLEDEAA
jgi:hypothetical protein